MMCESCGKNEANVHLTKIINGQKQEQNICEKCAEELEGFQSPFSFQNILSGIMEYMSPATQTAKSYELICKNCGATYNDFKKYGLLGCSECYKSFEPYISTVIKRVQGNTEHMGRIPEKLGKGIIEKKRIAKLKEDLQKAIANEEFEKAAQIRDMIKSYHDEA
jgi:protein arginine kinase activator